MLTSSYWCPTYALSSENQKTMKNKKEVQIGLPPNQFVLGLPQMTQASKLGRFRKLETYDNNKTKFHILVHPTSPPFYFILCSFLFFIFITSVICPPTKPQKNSLATLILLELYNSSIYHEKKMGGGPSPPLFFFQRGGVLKRKGKIKRTNLIGKKN